jgi:hypothetical protein
MGPRCSSAETQICHRSYIIAARLKVNLNKSELIPLGHSKVEIYTHNFSPGIKITTDKFKLLGIIIPTNGKQKDLIEENYYNKKKKY